MAAINGYAKDIKVSTMASTFTKYTVKINNHHS